MINFLLGVGDSSATPKTVSQQDFLEFENNIYERMKDVQDIARNVQSDQISFLNTNITIFLTVAGLILAGVGIFATVVLSRIKTANIKAQQKMDEANTLMATARELNEQANNNIIELSRKHEALNAKLEIMESRHNELGNILESKDLQSKLNELENSAELTALLNVQVKAMFYFQHSLEVINKTERIAGIVKDDFIDNEHAQKVIESILKACSSLKIRTIESQVAISFMADDLRKEGADELFSKASKQLDEAMKLNDEVRELRITLTLEAKEKIVNS